MPSTPSRLQIGAAYYPEHWPEEGWAEDIRLMRQADIQPVLETPIGVEACYGSARMDVRCSS